MLRINLGTLGVIFYVKGQTGYMWEAALQSVLLNLLLQSRASCTAWCLPVSASLLLEGLVKEQLSSLTGG